MKKVRNTFYGMSIRRGERKMSRDLSGPASNLLEAAGGIEKVSTPMSICRGDKKMSRELSGLGLEKVSSPMRRMVSFKDEVAQESEVPRIRVRMTLPTAQLLATLKPCVKRGASIDVSALKKKVRVTFADEVSDSISYPSSPKVLKQVSTRCPTPSARGAKRAREGEESGRVNKRVKSPARSKRSSMRPATPVGREIKRVRFFD